MYFFLAKYTSNNLSECEGGLGHGPTWIWSSDVPLGKPKRAQNGIPCYISNIGLKLAEIQNWWTNFFYFFWFSMAQTLKNKLLASWNWEIWLMVWSKQPKLGFHFWHYTAFFTYMFIFYTKPYMIVLHSAQSCVDLEINSYYFEI